MRAKQVFYCIKLIKSDEYTMWASRAPSKASTIHYNRLAVNTQSLFSRAILAEGNPKYSKDNNDKLSSNYMCQKAKQDTKITEHG